MSEIKLQLDVQERQTLEQTVDATVKRLAQEVQKLRQLQENLNDASMLSKALAETGTDNIMTLDEANAKILDQLVEALPYGRVKGIVKKIITARLEANG
jgi:dsDNA-specific endonuclease/ATPase MutS2